MKAIKQSVASATIAALMLASCGGGGGGSSAPPPVTVTPTPSPSPTAGCGLPARKAFAKAVIDEWYLFPDNVASNANPANYNDVQTYIDALVAPARALNKDR
jgi:carboxyl-terminal processing protease